MINFYDQVPSVYNNASRDFQYVTWLINIVLNSVKHNVDDIYNLPNTNADPRITELLAMTLGFKLKRNYNQRQLLALVSIIPSILKYKGTKKAISLAGNALINAAGISGEFKCNLLDNCLEIQLPDKLIDTVLFMDLLPYIAPAGLTTRVVSKTDDKTDKTTDVQYQDKVIADIVNIVDWSDEDQQFNGLATLYNENSSKSPEFTNFKQTGDKVLNAGLLDNSVIPAFSAYDTNNDDKANVNIIAAANRLEKEE